MMKKITADTIYTLKKKPKVVLTPDDIYEDGGIVQAWIQKFQGGGMTKASTGGASSGMIGGMMGGGNPASMIIQGITGAIGGIGSTIDADKQAVEAQRNMSLQNAYQKQETDRLRALEMEQQQQQFYQYGGKTKSYIQKFAPGRSPVNPYMTSYNNNTILDGNYEQPVTYQNPQYLGLGTDPSKISYTEQPSKFMNFANKNGQAINAAGTAMSSLSNMSGDNRKQPWQDAKSELAKSNPIFGAFHGIDEGLQGIGKMIGGDKGQKAVQAFTDPIGFIMNMGSGIEDREEKKRTKQLEYLTRNMPAVNQPSYYGQYMAKYGANPKMMEQRVIDDIYSDFDKYLKLT